MFRVLVHTAGFSPASLKMLTQMPKIMCSNPPQFVSRK